MKTYEVEFTYNRRKIKTVMSLVLEASCPMEAKAIARQYALNHWTRECPLKVTAVELLTPERLARDEAELDAVMGVAA
jgi:hypothetical protein